MKKKVMKKEHPNHDTSSSEASSLKTGKKVIKGRPAIMCFNCWQNHICKSDPDHKSHTLCFEKMNFQDLEKRVQMIRHLIFILKNCENEPSQINPFIELDCMKRSSSDKLNEEMLTKTLNNWLQKQQ